MVGGLRGTRQTETGPNNQGINVEILRVWTGLGGMGRRVVREGGGEFLGGRWGWGYGHRVRVLNAAHLG